jgi:multidrug resistance efflux pump
MLAVYEQLSGGQWAIRPPVPVALWWWDKLTWRPITGRGKCRGMARLLDAPQAKRAKTTAERQRAFRQRQADRTAALEAANAELRAEADGLRADLADALAETERLAAQQCKHPAAAVDGGTCRACGNDVW